MERRVDVYTEIPRLLGFYDFGHAPTILTGDGSDPKLANRTMIHEQAHKDDVFNTIYGRLLRTLLTRQDPACVDDEARAAFKQLLDGAWFTFEGSATFQEFCLEFLSEDGSGFDGVAESLPGQYRLALMLFNVAVDRLFQTRTNYDFTDPVEVYLVHSLCGFALSEFLLDHCIQDQYAAVDSELKLFDLYLNADSPDSALERLAQWPGDPIAISKLDLDLDAQILFTQKGLRQRRDYIWKLKSALTTLVRGPSAASLSDRQLLAFVTELGLPDSLQHPDQAFEVQETSYILRFENPDNIRFRMDTPVTSFDHILSFVSGVEEGHSLINVLAPHGELAYISTGMYDTRTADVTNGDMFESYITREQLDRIDLASNQQSIFIAPPQLIQLKFIPVERILRSSATWIIPFSDFSPQMIKIALEFFLGDRPRRAMRLEVSDTVEIVAIGSEPLYLAFATLIGSVDPIASDFGVERIADRLTILQWVALTNVQALLGGPPSTA
jgi:hypothetical protein